MLPGWGKVTEILTKSMQTKKNPFDRSGKLYKHSQCKKEFKGFELGEYYKCYKFNDDWEIDGVIVSSSDFDRYFY